MELSFEFQTVQGLHFSNYWQLGISWNQILISEQFGIFMRRSGLKKQLLISGTSETASEQPLSIQLMTRQRFMIVSLHTREPSANGRSDQAIWIVRSRVLALLALIVGDRVNLNLWAMSTNLRAPAHDPLWRVRRFVKISSDGTS